MTVADIDPAALRRVSRADVYKAGRRAAVLVRTEGGVEFRYHDDYRSGGGVSVASTLPLDAAPVRRPGGALPAYFTGLLPEGRRLTALRRSVKTSADDELTLLLAVGGDAVGDVQVVPEGEQPGPSVAEVVVDEITTRRFTDLLADLGLLPQRVALPGIQDKVSARMINVPAQRAGREYILKLTPPEFPHLVANEYFFLRAARQSGLSAVDAELVYDSADTAGLLVTRFDRSRAGGTQRRHAVEDGCQACDRPPADKYLIPTEQVFSTLAELCDARLVAGLELIKQLAFAYLSANGDAHAKNFSVVQQDDGEWRVSPAYDLPSSHPYGDVTMALVLGDRDRDFGRSDFLALGQQLGLRTRPVERALDDLDQRVDLWIDDLGTLPFDGAVTRKLRRVVDHRRSRLRSR